ncbi:MAG: hypothetical protein A2735_00290 [Candidatus Yanofskybacteria bacterium RIFCSPHIGHO2_01_FULL_41_21]|uniref:DUF4145 domain-containing protein n=1 Tax=Candidatus Yanofskybacteria bacterium RIFCSPHIGHO2_01_FULL_41_21 TaxID=1802660 RepID=A0A1F8EBF4_9BACT|nr:MAG: hypothetical protein A2735_00290 [Candidatus Yanofskybacteria bacterium RIFCSPHIGHO2_01_FULL_41_21]
MKEKRSAKNSTDALIILWEEGFFKKYQNFKSVCENLSSRGNNFPYSSLAIALRQAKFLTRRGKRGFFEYIQKHKADSEVIKAIAPGLFSDELLKSLQKDFKIELEDLKYNYGKSGNCTAFLLRKILEKLIYITFAKHNLISKLEDKSQTGRFVGLEAMIRLASSEKIEGVPFLISKTANEIQSIKFLGDTSAHNHLVEVDMKTIVPQMPYIITAYKELVKKL